VDYSELWADYDNDGFQDLLIVNNAAGAANLLYHNNRDGTFTRLLTGPIATDKGPESCVNGAWGDYDNDGFLDLFVATTAEGSNRLYHNNGDGTFTKINSGPMLAHAAGVDSTAGAWGDYDNDGHLDLFVSNSGGHNQLFHNNGDGTFTEILSGPPVEDGGPGITCLGTSWADYDNDGFLDLLVLNNLPSLLYHNDGNSNSWIEIKCVGTVSNRSAIGAKIRVRATIAGKSIWQMREISGARGYNTAPLVAHFGLGDATTLEVLRIEWPSGAVQEFHGVAARQILTVAEPSRLWAAMANGVPQIWLKGGRNLQYQIEASDDLAAWASIGTLSITNLDGTAMITDTNAPAANRRFYRAALR
jgi:hypothetical protein